MSSTKPKNSNSWEGLKGQSSKKNLTGSSKQSIRDLKLKGIFILLVLLGMGSASIFIFKNASSIKNFTLQPIPLKRIYFQTDGVLKASWVKRYLNLSNASDLNQLNLKALEAKLRKQQQIKSLNIEHVFPNSLKITLQERVPLLQAHIRLNRHIRRLFISTEGIPYLSLHYNPKQISKLPLLIGIQIRYKDKQFQPIEGITTLKTFLRITQNILPELKWKKISVKDLKPNPSTPGSRLYVFGQQPYKIIFKSTEISKQAQNFKKILLYLKNNPQNRPISSIDLSLKNPTVGFK